MAGMDNPREVISLLSAGGHVLCTSPSCARVLGYLGDEITGRRAIDLVHPDDRTRCRRALAAVLIRPPDPRRVELRVRRHDGGWVRIGVTIFNLLYEPCVGAILVSGSATGRVTGIETRAEEAANRELEDLASAVANDLKEPLRTISMAAELLVRDASLDASAIHHTQFIADEVKRMSILVEGLRSFAVRGAECPAPRVDPCHVVTNVLQDLSQLIEAAAATVTVGPLPMVRGNAEHLARIFKYLIRNSIKYRSDAPPRIHVSAERRGPDWMIRVSDNGAGIAREHHQDIFTLFSRLHGPETSGAGIGLAICRRLIELAGGTIWVESEPGAGSVFCFTMAPAAGGGTGPGAGSRDRIVVNGIRALAIRKQPTRKQSTRNQSTRKMTPPTEIRRGAPGR
jgi:PAS domain S-box-containing protein